MRQTYLRAPTPSMAWLVAYVGIAFLILAPRAAAQGPFEPNEDIAAATAIGADTVYGALESSADRDWYRVWLAGDRQVKFTVGYDETQRADCDGVDEARWELRDNLGEQIATQEGSSSYDYSVPPEGARVYVRFYVNFSRNTGCRYALTVSPRDAVVAHPPDPPRAPAVEPNESRSQAFGPLSGDVYYEGALETSNDVEEMYFYALGSRRVTVEAVQPSGCRDYFFRGAVTPATGEETLPGDVDGRLSLDLRNRQYVTFTSSPETARYNINLNGAEGCRWLILVSPASALTNTLAAPAAAPPSPECVGARRQRARLARLVAQAKRTLRRARSPRRRARARRSLRGRRALLREAERTVGRSCRT